jgi:UDP-N-acetyl-2-amino-2-deoxyglucuronate dehydrogenase
MENKLNFILVGCGRIGQRHAEQMKKYGSLLAVCDTDVQKAETLAKNVGAKAYCSIDELIADMPDARIAAVCTPNGLHAKHSIQLLSAGYNVLCEKPLGLTAGECGNMMQAAEKYNRRLFTVKQNRFNPPVVALKKLIDESRLGKIFSVQLNCFWNRNEDYYKNSWKGTLKLDGGTLYTQFSHFIDLIIYLVGDVKEVKAMTGNFAHQGIIEFEDTGVVVIKFNNGALGTINYTVNCFSKNMEGSITIFAEKGTVKVGGQYLNELEYQDIKDYTIQNLPKGNDANNYGNYVGSMSNHGEVYKNLVDVFIHNAAITTSGFDGYKTVDLIERIYKEANK